MQAAWRRHEYYVIATSTLTMKLAEVALRQQNALLERCKGKVLGAQCNAASSQSGKRVSRV